MTLAPMPFRPVVLWTDGLLYLLIVGSLVSALWFRRSTSFQSGWKRVFATPSAMAAAVILALYGTVAILDSIHFEVATYGQNGAFLGYSPRVLSALDQLCAKLRKHEEQSYSAPFALTSLVKTTIPGPGRLEQRVLPRLKWGGRGIAGSRAEERDVALRILRGTGEAFAVWIVLLGLVWGRSRHESIAHSWRMLWGGRLDLPWRACWITIGLVLWVVAVTTNLAGAYHVLGTDQVGIDVLYKSLKSIRTGVIIGTLTTLVTMPFAIVLGIVAGYFGGFVDDLIQYLYTTLSSIPGVLLIAASVLSLDLFLEKHASHFQSVLERADIRLLFLCIVLGITSWTSLCRLLRGETLKLREMEYVQAAIALGQRRRHILLRHILPNVMHIVLISVVLDFSGFVLAEAVLTFVGVGVDPTTFSWGTMIDGARLELAREPVVWWNLGAAFAFMLVLVLAANVFADAVRDAFDPRFQRR